MWITICILMLSVCALTTRSDQSPFDRLSYEPKLSEEEARRIIENMGDRELVLRDHGHGDSILIWFDLPTDVPGYYWTEDIRKMQRIESEQSSRQPEEAEVHKRSDQNRRWRFDVSLHRCEELRSHRAIDHAVIR